MEDTWLDCKEVKRVLTLLQITPSRRLGQSFLVDASSSHKIVEALDPSPQDVVLEIGPGMGALTGFLLGRVKEVHAIELDARLATFLKERFEKRSDFSVLNADILKMDIESFLSNLTSRVQSPGSVKVIGNLPYRVSTQILFRFLECPVHPERMVFAFQWEVAQRLTASPRTKDYGAMTLTTQLHAEIRRLMRVKRASFYPPPEVDTGILGLTSRALDLGISESMQPILFKMIKEGFSHRRKTLRNALTSSRILPYTGEKIEQALRVCHFNLKARAEDLTLKDFAGLVKSLSGS